MVKNTIEKDFACDKAKLTCDQEELTCDREDLTCDKENLTCDKEKLTCKKEELTCDKEKLKSKQKEVTRQKQNDENIDIKQIICKLEEKYPTAKCELEFSSTYELLIAVILSAQCTDKRVNKVTKELFARCNTPESFANMEQAELEKYIFSCGFYHNKAKNIIACSKSIVSRFGGQVPSELEQLVTLDGVGRKTANVVVSVGFGEQAIAVDTHVLRLSNRLGLVTTDNPQVAEMKLREIVPQENWSKMHHLLIFHGRYTCHSRNPQCQECPIAEYCKYTKTINKERLENE
ncbi:MAG: endonuclease III [Clostridia bacterium]